jgi:hypothetical protein
MAPPEERVPGSKFKVQGSGFKVQGSEFKVQGSGFKVQGSEFKVQGSGFRVRSSGFKGQGLKVELPVQELEQGPRQCHPWRGGLVGTVFFSLRVGIGIETIPGTLP